MKTPLVDLVVDKIAYTVVASSLRFRLAKTSNERDFYRSRKDTALFLIQALARDASWPRLAPVFQRHCRKWISFLKREKENQNQNKITHEHNQTQAGI